VHIDVLRPLDKRARQPVAGRVIWNWHAIGSEWRALEGNANGSFFQSWTWVGCQVARRFTNPLLLRATDAGRVVGLALFNQTGPRFARTLWLNETGRKAEDSVFIEHNGPLLAHGCEFLLQPMLELAASYGRLILSGVDAAVLEAARLLRGNASDCCRISAKRGAPYLDLTELHASQDWLGTLGTSTRYRLRRSHRAYEREWSGGKLVVHAATNVLEALRFLDALAALHQSRWTARGKPGAFAEPAFTTFHQALVTCAVPRGEVELLQVSLVDDQRSKVIGYLYNLRWQNKVYAYQSGFDYQTIDRHQLPGLTCHSLAITTEIASKTDIYDFMAGESQYKNSLSNSKSFMYWLTISGSKTHYRYFRRLSVGLKSILRKWGFIV
jgi:CelD/BcsL family acetyltransferase involved in cellulose biosynthesis